MDKGKVLIVMQGEDSSMDLDADIELDNDVELDELNQGKQPAEVQYDDKLNEDYGREWDFLVVFVKVCEFGL